MEQRSLHGCEAANDTASEDARAEIRNISRERMTAVRVSLEKALRAMETDEDMAPD